jgi:hypothetical protein
MSAAVTTEVWFVKDIIDKWIKKEYVKPYVQRRRVWTKLKDREYLDFIVEMKNAVTPFIINKKIKDSKEVWYVWDGNNRTNVMLSFIQRPLQMMEDLLPPDTMYSPKIRQILLETDLNSLLSMRNFKQFCKSVGEFEWYRHHDNPALDDPFDKIIDTLRHFDILNIKVPMTFFLNASDESMVRIYENVNKGGTPVSLQDVLAASTYDQLYKPAELEHYRVICPLIESYYACSEANEVLTIDREAFNLNHQMNLFQVLLGFNSYLHVKFKQFVPKPSDSTKGNSLDIVFDAYRYLVHPNFLKSPETNNFLKKMEASCAKLHEVRENLFNTTINYKKIDKKGDMKHKMHKNAVLLLLIYIYKNYDAISADPKILRRIVFYHILTTCINQKSKPENPEHFAAFSTYNPIAYKEGGQFIPQRIKHILNDTGEFTPPSVERTMKLIQFLNNEEVERIDSEERSELTTYQAIILSLYYNLKVPTDLLHAEKELDHIIPYSTKCGSDIINIHRIGNKMLIDKTTNGKRLNKEITDAFIKEHNLYYYNYPSEDQYKSIVDTDVKLLSKDNYNRMCIEREDKFFATIQENL